MVSNELHKMRKEAAVAYLKALSRDVLGGRGWGRVEEYHR
jgi:hypothetical protein